MLAKLRTICLALPEVYEERAWVGTRWMVRKRNFAHVLAIEDAWPPAYARAAKTEGPCVVLTVRASQDAFVDPAPPLFECIWGTRWGTKVLGMRLGARIDWDEVESLIEMSYRLVAPRTLAAARVARRKMTQ